MGSAYTRSIAASIVMTGLVLGWADDSAAQLKGHYFPGFTGLQNGSQPPPSVSLLFPVYLYTTDEIKDDDGNTIELPEDARVNVGFTGLGAMWVTRLKILGGNLGGSVVPIAYIKSRSEGNSLEVPGEWQFTDISVTPVQLGWHTSRADYVTGYTFFAPAGEWELGGDNNTGLGMWSHLFQAGTTLRLDDQRAWSLSSLGSYEIHSEKEETEIQVGDILTLEGGLARSWYKVEMVGERPEPKRIINLGLVYYAQFKVTEDTGPLLTPLLEGKEDRVFGVGLEGNVIFVPTGTLLGFRALPEFGARNRMQGWTFMFTFAQGVKSLAREGER